MLSHNPILSTIASIKASELALKVKQNKLDNASEYVDLLKKLYDESAQSKKAEQEVIAISPLANGTELLITSFIAKNPDFIIAHGFIDSKESVILSSIHQFQVYFSLISKTKEKIEIGFHNN
ncbi:MAG: hypothetical protein JEY94_09970 [Melioribacteraceae bacterium]|nr:hypothetical protein [Melioribacteraceae bacterium]